MERKLVELAMHGDEEAFDALIERVGDQLHSVARRILRDPYLAEDATQRALLEAWRHLPGLRDPDRFEAWLYRLLVNACHAEARREGRHRTNLRLLDSDEPAGHDPTSQIATRLQIDQAFRRLGVEHRTVVVLIHYLGLSAGEAAEAMGTPVGTVRSRLHYALKHLREAVEADARTEMNEEHGMNPNDDFIAQLGDYLETFDGVTPLPDRVRDAIRAELPSARQVQPLPGLLRVFTMLSNTSAVARLGLGAAAIVVAVVLGGAFLYNGRSEGVVGGAPSPTATPAPTPTIAPTATPAPSASVVPTLDQAPLAPCGPADTASGCLAAGTYRLTGGDGVWPVQVTIDVPAGWFTPFTGNGWDAVLVDKGKGPSGWGVMFYTVGDVARDPCDSTKGWIPAEQVDTPQKLAAAMSAWPRFTATTPQPIKIDGHSGLKFTLTSTAKASCADAAFAGHSTSGASVDVYPMVSPYHDPSTVEIVDTGNGLLVLRATDFPQASHYEVDNNGLSPDPTFHAGDQADLHAILDSIRLTALPATP